MSSKQRTILRNIARNNMLKEGIYRPNKKERVKRGLYLSYMQRHWREYAPIKTKSKKVKVV